jgi:VanZ family protein
MLRPRLLRVAIWCALAIHWITIFTLTHLPAKDLPKVEVNDKVEHATAYFVLSVLLYLSIRLARPIKYLPWIVFVACAAYGALDEYLQYALPIHRDASVWDWTADVTGTVIGVIVAWAVASALLRQGIAPEKELPQRS